VSRFGPLGCLVAAALLALALGGCGGSGGSGDKSIVIGLNMESTGSIPNVGAHSQAAAEMFADEVNDEGGVTVGDEQRTLELVVADNAGTAKGATAAAENLIDDDDVLVMVGPNVSVAAVPAGAVANERKTPMISPWSTNPATTLGRPWVFRVPYTDLFQGPILAKFAARQFDVKRACVLFAADSDAPRGQAESFRVAWEANNGAGSVPAYESFTTGTKVFRDKLEAIAKADCDVLFTPQYYNEVPLIVRQARSVGLDIPILGSDAWSDPQLMARCGRDCDGTFYGAHYVAAGAAGATKEFIDKFKARVGEVPSDVGALTWDAMRLVVQAIENCGELTGDLAADRECFRDGLAAIREFEGITGKMSFTQGKGDPVKCMVIAKIVQGEARFHGSACP
jgi:branched-chain amino acid transport system substrate-binding protein